MVRADLGVALAVNDAIAVAVRDPATWAARNAIVDLHRQCRADSNAVMRVVRAGGVDAAAAVLKATGGVEALGLLWTLSASKGTLQHFTLGSLEAVISTGRNAGDGWRRTAALSTMHNLLCYDGHDLVLSSSLGSLELAVDILCKDVNPSVKSAASKLLDQCCFDERSKLAAARLLPIPVMADILRQSLSKGCQPTPAGTREEANEHALLLLVEDMLSVLWNASDDVFFSSSTDWEAVTALLCEPSLLDALRACLTSPVISHQQAASATLHNMACNPALLPRLLEAGVAAELSKLAQEASASPSSICAILAVTELCGMDESKCWFKDNGGGTALNYVLMGAVVHELDRRVAVAVTFEPDSHTARLQEVVGTRKLVSAIDLLACRADSKIPLLREGVIGIIVALLGQGRTDARGAAHCCNILLHLAFEPVCNMAMHKAHPDLLPTLRQLCADADATTSNAAKAVVYMLLNLDSLTPRSARSSDARSSPVTVALLSYHERDSDLAARIRGALASEGSCRLCATDDRLAGTELGAALAGIEEAHVLIVIVSRALKRSARSRLSLNIAVRRGCLIVPVAATDGYVADGWLAALASPADTDKIAAQIPRVGTSPVTEQRIVGGLKAFFQRLAPAARPASNEPPLASAAVSPRVLPARDSWVARVAGAGGSDSGGEGMTPRSSRAPSSTTLLSSAPGAEAMTPRTRSRDADVEQVSYGDSHARHALAYAESQPSFLATAFAGLVNTLSPRGMPATPRSGSSMPPHAASTPSPRLGLLLKQDYDGGDVYVGTVVAGGMAARTGAVREGDVITCVDGCTTAGLTLLAVTELIRGIALSESKARARARDSRCMHANELRLILRRHGRPLEAIMPRPPCNLQALAGGVGGGQKLDAETAYTREPTYTGREEGRCTGAEQSGSSACREHSASSTCKEHAYKEQGYYKEHAVPLHLRARIGTSGAHSERAAPHSQPPHTSHSQPPPMPSQRNTLQMSSDSQMRAAAGWGGGSGGDNGRGGSGGGTGASGRGSGGLQGSPPYPTKSILNLQGLTPSPQSRCSTVQQSGSRIDEGSSCCPTATSHQGATSPTKLVPSLFGKGPFIGGSGEVSQEVNEGGTEVPSIRSGEGAWRGEASKASKASATKETAALLASASAPKETPATKPIKSMHLKHRHINSVERAHGEAEEAVTQYRARATVNKPRPRGETSDGGADTSDMLLLHATSHESDSEEWVEESPSSPVSQAPVSQAPHHSSHHHHSSDDELSCDDQSSDEAHSSHQHLSHVSCSSCSSDADSGTDTTDTSGSDSGSVGGALAVRRGSSGSKALLAPRTSISCRHAPLSLELLCNLRACVLLGGWMSCSERGSRMEARRSEDQVLDEEARRSHRASTSPTHHQPTTMLCRDRFDRLQLACVLHAWSKAVDDSWHHPLPPHRLHQKDGKAHDEAVGVVGVEDVGVMSHSEVVVWLHVRGLAPDWKTTFEHNKVDGRGLAYLASLFRSNLNLYLAHVKAEHGVWQYGVALSLAYHLIALPTKPPLDARGGGSSPPPRLKERKAQAQHLGGEAEDGPLLHDAPPPPQPQPPLHGAPGGEGAPRLPAAPHRVPPLHGAPRLPAAPRLPSLQVRASSYGGEANGGEGAALEAEGGGRRL